MNNKDVSKPRLAIEDPGSSIMVKRKNFLGGSSIVSLKKIIFSYPTLNSVVSISLFTFFIFFLKDCSHGAYLCILIKFCVIQLHYKLV